MIKERPILFNFAMVNALLNGNKTMTRRTIKVQPEGRLDFENGYLKESSQIAGCWHVDRKQRCPYGNVGERLWVRETFVLENTEEYHGDHTIPEDGRPFKTISECNEEYCLIPHYRATEPEPHIVPYSAVLTDDNDDKTRWTPSIFMPRWASRILLEITDVRVERLNDISDKDAIDEGISNQEHHWHDPEFPLPDVGYKTPSNLSYIYSEASEAFKNLWESINPKEIPILDEGGKKIGMQLNPASWDANPYVWCVSFKVATGES